MGWSAPSWIGFSDQDYSKILHRRALAVTRRDKRRGGNYTVKQAIEAMDQAFHRCNGFDPYDGSKLDPDLLGEYRNEDAKAEGAEYKIGSPCFQRLIKSKPSQLLILKS